MAVSESGHFGENEQQLVSSALLRTAPQLYSPWEPLSGAELRLGARSKPNVLRNQTNSTTESKHPRALHARIQAGANNIKQGPIMSQHTLNTQRIGTLMTVQKDDTMQGRPCAYSMGWIDDPTSAMMRTSVRCL